MSLAATKDRVSEQLRQWFLPVIGLSALGAGMLDMHLPDWSVDMLRQWGPAGVLIVGFTYYVPRTVIRDFIDSQQRQATALTSLADSVRGLPQKDHMKFEEIIIGQEMLNRSLDRVHARLDELSQDLYGKAHQG